MSDSTFSPSESDPRRDAAINSYLEALARGQPMDTEQFLARYPGLEEPLREFLENHQAVALALTWQGDANPPQHQRYEVYQVLKRGGMGVIWRCRDRVLGRELAVKTLQRGLQHQPDLVARFQEEAQIGSQLHHPGIPPVYDLDRLENGQPFFTMKLVKGRNLAELLAERNSPGDELPRYLGIFQQVCQTVAYAHDRKVLHRDLKPANIMVGAFGEVQVIDWGLGKVLTGAADTTESRPAGGDGGEPQAADVETVRTRAADAATSADTVLGTYRYMPPEQAQAREIDQRSDVFGLGAILCEILAGQPPYTGTTWEEVSRQAKTADLADAFGRLDACGADLELVKLTKACLAAEPDQRPAGAAAVAEGVTTYLNKVQEKLRKAELARTRLRWQFGLVAAVFLAVLGAVVGWAWYTIQREAEAADARERFQAAMQRARLFQDQGRLAEALAAGRNAQELAADSHLAPEARESARALIEALETETTATAADRRLLARVLDAFRPTEAPIILGAGKGGLALAPIDLDTQFRSAFQEYGLDLHKVTEDEILKRLRGRPKALQIEVTAVFDFWVFEARKRRLPKDLVNKLAAVARALDPDPQRAQLRRIVEVQQANADAGPDAAVAGVDRESLLKLADGMKQAKPPVLTVRLLALALVAARQRGRALEVLRQAHSRHPDVVSLNWMLVTLLPSGDSVRRGEALAYLQAARAVQPDLGLALAFMLTESGKPGEALDVCQDLVDREPKSALPHVYLGMIHTHQHRPGDAEKSFRDAVRLQPNLAFGQVALGRSLTELKRFAEAEAVCREAIRLDPDLAFGWNNLGLALHQQRKHQEAEAAYRKAIELDPGIPHPHSNRAEVLRLLKRYDEAEEACRRALEIEPEFMMAHNNLGLVFLDRRQLAEAETSFRKAVRLAPDEAIPHSNLGLVLCERWKLVEAETVLREAVRLNGSLPHAHSNLGMVLALRYKLDEAEKSCREAIRLDPTLAEPYSNLGGILQERRCVKEAENAFRQALRLQPDLAYAHANLGLLLVEQKRFEDAEKACREAVRLQAGNPAIHANLGLVLLAQKKFPEAEAACREAIRLQPDLAPAHSKLGLCLAEAKRWKEAEKACREALRLDPELSEAHANLGGVLLMSRNTLKEAETALRTALRLRPNFAEAHAALGKCLIELKRFADAERACRDAVRLQPDFAAGHNNLGLALSEQQRYKEAETCLREAIRLDPKYALAHNNLGVALQGQKKFKEAEPAYRESILLEPDPASAHSNLGACLNQLRRWKEGEAACRTALRLEPDSAFAKNNLGVSLVGQRRFQEAETACREAIRLDRNLALAHSNLAACLNELQRWKEAEPAGREAIRLDAGLALGHLSLGGSLLGQNKLKEAEAVFRTALRLDPGLGYAHAGLGTAALLRGNLQEAETHLLDAVRLEPGDGMVHLVLGGVQKQRGQLAAAADNFRRAIQCRPPGINLADLYNTLGLTCLQDRQPVAAAEAFRKTAELSPTSAIAHNNLGAALNEVGEFVEAVSVMRKAIRLYGSADQVPANCHNHLGRALMEVGKMSEAIAELRKGIKQNPGYAAAHRNLGEALKRTGQLPEAMAALEETSGLLPSNFPDWPAMMQALKDCKLLLEIDPHLSAFLSGEKRPANTAERLALAELLVVRQQFKAAAQRFEEAFAADPKCMADAAQAIRSRAAIAAAQALDKATKLPATEADRWRRQALDWLKADLTALTKLLDADFKGKHVLVRRTLRLWQLTPTLAHLRDGDALDRLPLAERQAWRRFWDEVAAGVGRVPIAGSPKEKNEK